MLSENIAQNMWMSHGIINYPAQLYLFGHFRILLDNHRFAYHQTIMKYTATLEEKRAMYNIHTLIESNKL
jgi:hypothetical protein